ncbi:MAG: glycine/betaine/sarcosine/D-proline family reductase selenoprotein B [Pyramidobacter sp.]|jgi:betaine reductase
MSKAEIVYSLTDEAGETQSNVIPFIAYNRPAPKRCLDMLLSKYYGKKFCSEVTMPVPEEHATPVLHMPLSAACLMMITDGGLVPRGNPDGLPPSNAREFHAYSFGGAERLEADKYEVSHQGYSHADVAKDPNRLLPLDVLRELTREGVIGGVYPLFLSTTGVMMPAQRARRLSEAIADRVAACPVDAVLVVSTCGTSTRCGAFIVLALEDRGIPTVQIANLTEIAWNAGVRHLEKGASVGCPVGFVELSEQEEYRCRRRMVCSALRRLCAEKL